MLMVYNLVLTHRHPSWLHLRLYFGEWKGSRYFRLLRFVFTDEQVHTDTLTLVRTHKILMPQEQVFWIQEGLNCNFMPIYKNVLTFTILSLCKRECIWERIKIKEIVCKFGTQYVKMWIMSWQHILSNNRWPLLKSLCNHSVSLHHCLSEGLRVVRVGCLLSHCNHSLLTLKFYEWSMSTCYS